MKRNLKLAFTPTSLTPILVCLLAIDWCCGTLYWFSDWFGHLSYKQRNADHWLATHLPPDSILIGAVSLGLSLDNRFQCVNVIQGLCNDVHPVESAAPAPRFILILDRTHSDLEAASEFEKSLNNRVDRNVDRNVDRWKEQYWIRNYPDLVRPERQIKAFPQMLRPFFTIGVYPVPASYPADPHSRGEQKAQSDSNNKSKETF